MVKGRSYTLTFDKEPTQKDIIKALAEAMDSDDNAPDGSMKYYANLYLDKKRKAKRSSTTILNYASIVKNTPEWFLALDLKEVTTDLYKKAIEEYSIDRSAKTTANFNGFYKAVFADFRPSFSYKAKLSKGSKKIEYEPSTKDIKAILQQIKGHNHELFIRLSILGLRRGETAALTSADLSDDNILTISKDLVKGEDNKYYIKNCPKTSASYRRILIPQDVADLLREKEKTLYGDISKPYKYLQRVLKKLDIPAFPLHTLRHFAAAFLLKKNSFTKEQVQEYMGWEKGSAVMDKVYSYNLDPEDSQKDIADAFKSLF